MGVTNVQYNQRSFQALSETGDYRETEVVRQLSKYRYNSLLSSITVGLISTCDVFDLLPVATTVTAVSDKFHLLLGSNTPLATQSTKGGLTLTTGATSTNIAGVGGIANTGMSHVISATNGIIWRGRVNLASLATALYTAGLSATNTAIAINPGGSVDAAQFLADPTNSLTATTGATAAQALNWILCTSVAGTSAYQFTNVPIVAGQDQELSITVNPGLDVTYLINHVAVNTAVTAALTNAAVLKSVIGVETLATATAAMDVRYDELEVSSPG
jgi:hypothetical protein